MLQDLRARGEVPRGEVRGADRPARGPGLALRRQTEAEIQGNTACRSTLAHFDNLKRGRRKHSYRPNIFRWLFNHTF